MLVFSVLIAGAVLGYRLRRFAESTGVAQPYNWKRALIASLAFDAAIGILLIVSFVMGNGDFTRLLIAALVTMLLITLAHGIFGPLFARFRQR